MECGMADGTGFDARMPAVPLDLFPYGLGSGDVSSGGHLLAGKDGLAMQAWPPSWMRPRPALARKLCRRVFVVACLLCKCDEKVSVSKTEAGASPASPFAEVKLAFCVKPKTN